MEFNKQQKAAIEKHGGGIKNILVSAGAGSGKTAVLAERVVRLVCDINNNTDIDRLLIMTFTKNAASEMRERIGAKLKEKAAQLMHSDTPVPAEIVNVKNQLSLLNRANINTIDSFCNNVLRQYFYKVNVDPAYRIAGDDSCQELSALGSEAMDELFEQRFEADDADFLMLMDYFCPSGLKDKRLREILTELDRLLSSVPYPQEWLKNALAVYKTEDGKPSKKMLDSLIQYKNTLCLSARTQLDRAMSLIYRANNNLTDTADTAAAAQLFGTLDDIVTELENCRDFDVIGDIVPARLPVLKKPKNAADEVIILFNELSSAKEKFSKSLSTIKKNILSLDIKLLCDMSDRLYGVVKALFELYTDYTALYTEKKNDRAVLSFADVNHYCVKILLNDDHTPTAEALEYRKRFDEIIVDEYQDNNELQEYLLSAVSDNNLFMVGDIKQSIYKFRHAKPEIFASKFNTYNKTDLTAGDICIRLSTNYRSRRSVLDLSNFIFYQLMRMDFGGIDYMPEDALVEGRLTNAPDTAIADRVCSSNELIICSKAADKSYDDEVMADIQELANDEYEAHTIAKRISELIDPADPEYVYDTAAQQYRPCTLADITILMRSSNRAGHIYTGILNRYGIPSVANSRYSLFDELEIKTIMSLLKVLDNPYRDSELILALHSPIFNVSCNELAKIKLVDMGGKMYDNMTAVIEHSPDSELSLKLKKFKALEEKVHKISRSKPFAEVLDAIYRLTDYMNYVGMIRNGEIRVENLRILSNLAAEIFNSGVVDFGGIVKKLCDIEQEKPEFDSLTLSEQNNAVKIMSIHKSKGLEFPVVILAQAGKNLHKMGRASDIVISDDYGISFSYYDEKTRVKSKFAYREAVSTLAKRDAFTEEARLLYVALTRAKDKLIITGVAELYKTMADIDECEGVWNTYADSADGERQLPLQAIHSANSYLDWIMMCRSRADVLNNALCFDGVDPIAIDDILSVSVKSMDNLKEDEFDAERILQNYKSVYAEEAPQQEERELNIRLTSDYLDAAAVALPSKISISEIKRQRLSDEYEQLEYKLSELNEDDSERLSGELEQDKKKDTAVIFDDPEFLKEAKTTLFGAQRGTAYHTVMEHLDMRADSDEAYVKAQIDDMHKRHILSDAEYNSVSAEKFVRFLHSPLGRRICAATAVHREAPFVMSLTPDAVYPDKDYGTTGAKILVHGIIDLYFEEDGAIVLVDYKTDSVKTEGDVQKLCQKYKIQLDYYRKAIEKSCDLKVKEMYLYLLSADKEAQIPV